MIRGGDGMAGFAVRHPSGQMVHPYQWQANADYTGLSKDYHKTTCTYLSILPFQMVRQPEATIRYASTINSQGLLENLSIFISLLSSTTIGKSSQKKLRN